MLGHRALRCFLMALQLAATTMVSASFFEPFNVSYDYRALILGGKRRMLISAGIHYPRPLKLSQMRPDLIAKSKEGGADLIQTYVFWNGHEPSRGQYNFEGRYDLVKFAKLIGSSGLYLHLRIGPYACAEWNFGGFPVWLRDIPGIEFRTNNEPFKDEMKKFVKKIVNLMKQEMLFSWQGGPIILLQIANEYGNIEDKYGHGGKEYVKWTARMALSLGADVPWVMCRQTDAPETIINSCNAFYCDGFKPNSYKKPALWTEDWNGWYVNASIVRTKPTTFDAPEGNDTIALDLGSMEKGQAWVNGHGIGRFWSLVAPKSGCPKSCNYRGTYNENKCTTNCGKPTQTRYHIPRVWLQPSNDLLVLFDEVGGNPLKISLKVHSTKTICAEVAEDHYPPLSAWSNPDVSNGKMSISKIAPEVHLRCDGGQKISDVTFASYGNPTGSCQGFSIGKCHAQSSLSLVSEACRGKNKCSISVSNEVFGDPCRGTIKSLVVQAECSSTSDIKLLHSSM